MMYYYGMRLRGFSPGCQPKKGLVCRIESDSPRWHDVLIYDRPLTTDELKEYELDFICEE